jgi:hypothetical protein
MRLRRSSLCSIPRHSFSRAFIALLLTALALGQFLSSAVYAGAPLYPDLVPIQTSRILIGRDGGNYILRFDSTTANFGGPLEIVVPSLANRQIYQKVYDAKIGGKVVLNTKIGADILYHPTHNHFHFQEFNDFSLVKRDSKGIYRETSRVGDKSSFCILDLMRVASGGPSNRTYGACGATRQGLSSGWADIYDASLPGQYINLGSSMLSDGMYGIRTTADPSNKLIESNDNNNTLVSYFSISGGRLIVSGTQPPLCAANGAAGSVAGPKVVVGQSVSVTCTGQKPGESVQFFWGSTNTDPKMTAVANQNGVATANITIPVTDLGVHYILARGQVSAVQSAALVNVIPSMALSPTSVKIDAGTTVTLRGFSPGETVDIGFYKTSGQRSVIGSTVISSNGSGSATVVIPASVYGRHDIDAVGISSHQSARTYLRVRPSIALNVSEPQPGDDAGLLLRGFAAGEIVKITIVNPDTNLGQVVTSYSGSSRSSTDRVIIPEGLGPGNYTLKGVGQTSGATATGPLMISAAQTGSDPTDTPSATATASATGTVTGEATSTIEATATTPQETVTETATSEPTVTETATAVPTATESPTDVPTATEPPTEVATATPTETATSPP